MTWVTQNQVVSEGKIKPQEKVILGESLVAQLINASSREQKGPGFESQRGQKS